MTKLKDVKPGQFLYTVYIDYDDNGNCITITIAQRKITNIRENTRHPKIKTIMMVERIDCKYFGDIVDFPKEEDDKYLIENRLGVFDFIYCFSEEVFMEQINKTLRKVKEELATKNMFYFINSYYHKFMPNLMAMLNSNKSTYVQITI